MIQGPDSRVFILSARHCVALPSATGLNPWSSYVAIFNYDVPCGSDEIDPAQFTQSLQVRGWSWGVARIEFSWRCEILTLPRCTRGAGPRGRL